MKGDLRCIEGRLFRHDPQLDDPDLETDVGECPECQGKGCEEVDYYGNPVDEGRIINCCFPDCGCDEMTKKVVDPEGIEPSTSSV